MRRLVWMAEGKQGHAWAIASSQMALLAEVNRNPKKRSRSFRPAEFNPMIQEQSKPAKATVQEAASILGISGSYKTKA